MSAQPNMIATTRLIEPEGEYVISYGVGVDSTCMIIECHNHGWKPPAAITFGDTGAEKPETYAYLAVMNEWLDSVGWPQITVCRKIVTPPTALEKYTTFTGAMFYRKTTPFFSWGKIGCSDVWKQSAQNYYIKGCKAPHNKIEPHQIWKDYQAGAAQITKLIGYDATEIKRIIKSDKCGEKTKDFKYRYPLYDLGHNRQDCIRIIQTAGLPVPLKSACFFCPSSQPWEILWLAAKHPDLLGVSLQMERNAAQNMHTCKGLGITFSWIEFCIEQGVVDPDLNFIGNRAEIHQKAMALKSTGGNAADLRTC